MFKSPRFQLVELIMTATATGALQTIYFQSQPQLQSVTGDNRVYIKALEVFGRSQILSSPLTAGNPVAQDVDLANAVLTLSVNGSLDFQFLPLSRLNQVQSNNAGGNNTNGHIFLLRNVYKIDWTKSYITTILAPGSGGTTAGPLSYLFGVHYGYKPDADDLSADSVIAAIAATQGQKPGGPWIS